MKVKNFFDMSYNEKTLERERERLKKPVSNAQHESRRLRARKP